MQADLPTQSVRTRRKSEPGSRARAGSDRLQGKRRAAAGCISAGAGQRKPTKMSRSKYKADIAGGSLKLPESRIVAGLLLDDVTKEEWRRAIEDENILQKRSPGTAARQASLLRARLETMTPDLWRLVRDGSKETATHSLLAAAVKHSPLFAEFLNRVVRERFRAFQNDLPRKLWNEYVEHLRDEDPAMPVWNDATANKLGDSVFQILKEAGFITDTRTYRLQPVQIAPAVLTYLRDTDQLGVIERLQVSL